MVYNIYIQFSSLGPYP